MWSRGLSSGYSCDTLLGPGAGRALQKRKRKKGAEAEQKNIYSVNEKTLERLRLFYHGGKVMGSTMEI